MTNTCTVKIHGLALEVKYSAVGPSKGHRNTMGVPEEPDYDAEVDIAEVCHNGEEILCIMDDAAIRRIEREIREGRAEH
jgi:hypothetical protein